MSNLNHRVNPKPKLERRQALRVLVDLSVRAADEALNRDSELVLREAAARICDALAYERRAMQ